MKRSELEGKISSIKQAISTEKSSVKIQKLTDQLHSYEERIRALDKKKKEKNKTIVKVPLKNIKPLSVAELIKNDFDLDKVLNNSSTKKVKVLATYTLTREIDIPTNFDAEHFDIRKYWKRHLSHKEINNLLMSLKDVSLTV